MQRLVKVQRRNGTIEEMPDWMANDQRLQKKHGWRVIHIPTTVEELKAEVKPFTEATFTESEQPEIVNKRGRPKKDNSIVETK